MVPREPLAPKTMQEVHKYWSAVSKENSSSSWAINSAAREGQASKKRDKLPSEITPFNWGHYQKVLSIIRVRVPSSVKAIRTILQMILPIQAILICGKLTLKATIIMQEHEGCRGLSSEGPMGHEGGRWMVIKVGHVSSGTEPSWGPSVSGQFSTCQSICPLTAWSDVRVVEAIPSVV